MKTKFSDKMSKTACDFIDVEKINALIDAGPADAGFVREVIAKARDKQALSVEETAALINTDEALTEEIYEAARQLKQQVYGNRIVLFAPLYVGNECVNACKYCSFHRDNKDQIRRTLTDDQLETEVTALINKGHKRLILVYGEHPLYTPEYIAHTVRKVYSVKSGHGEIRRVNINAAPMETEGYKLLKEAGIGTFQIFQETYHRETYKYFHGENSIKSDFLWRLDGLSRAFEAGLDDMGIGALFGLYDWRFDLLGLVTHALFLQKTYGVGPHTISFPRIQPAAGVEVKYPHIVGDEHFKKLIAILRLAVPYTGLICTARESPEIRRAVMAFGVSQIDAGSRIEIGGYTEVGDAQCMEREQFSLGDIRSLDETMRELLEDDYVPSFCTACYRLGRTGEHFMEFAIPGFIKRYCTPNALSTLQEYLMDYASPETRAVGEAQIQRELERLEDTPMKQELLKRLEEIRTADKRDLYF